MSILIGHASIDENGKTQGGAAGDQTGKEVCTRTWYSKPWDFMAFYPTESVREKHAAAVEAACANDCIGYDQNQRNTLYTQAKAVNFDLAAVKTKCETDCSALQNVAAICSGAVSVASYGSHGWTSSTMKAKLKAAGYKIIEGSKYLTDSKYCVRGAIYVKAGSHTVCGLTNGSAYKETLAAAGITTGTTSSTSSATVKVTAPTYTVGKTYMLVVDKLNVRAAAGTGAAKITYSKLTANAKKNAYMTGQLKKGTTVTCKATTTDGAGNIWMQIPSGWIAAYYGGEFYVK